MSVGRFGICFKFARCCKDPTEYGLNASQGFFPALATPRESRTVQSCVLRNQRRTHRRDLDGNRTVLLCKHHITHHTNIFVSWNKKELGISIAGVCLRFLSTSVKWLSISSEHIIIQSGSAKNTILPRCWQKSWNKKMKITLKINTAKQSNFI